MHERKTLANAVCGSALCLDALSARRNAQLLRLVVARRWTVGYLMRYLLTLVLVHRLYPVADGLVQMHQPKSEHLAHDYATATAGAGRGLRDRGRRHVQRKVLADVTLGLSKRRSHCAAAAHQWRHRTV